MIPYDTSSVFLSHASLTLTFPLDPMLRSTRPRVLARVWMTDTLPCWQSCLI